MKIINENIKELIKLSRKYDREMPTEILSVYDVQANKITTDYKYDFVYTNESNKTASSIARIWFEQIKYENN